MKYNLEHKEWANFVYDRTELENITNMFAEMKGEMKGLLQNLNTAEQQKEIIQFMLSEAIKTSEIEGEYLSRQDIMSSIKNRLGLSTKKENIKDKRAMAVSNLLVEARNSYSKKLSETMLKQWHELLFEGNKNIRAGKYRKGNEAMQVISGAMGKEIVHYEAPPSERVPLEMKKFILWYNNFETDNLTDIIVKTAISHLYFESIHPFEDGNGRIGRAIAEKCLSQSLGQPVLLSLSSVIEKNKKDYYASLKKAQSSLEITQWIIYFANIILQAQKEAIEIVLFSLKKTRLFDTFKDKLNSRELKAIKKMLDAGTEGFEGGMTTKKYISIVRTTKSTAIRDLQHLTQSGILSQHGKGRNIHYELVI